MIKYSIKNNGNISRRKEDCIDDAIIAYIEIYDCDVSVCGPFIQEFKEPVKSTRKQAMELVKRFEKDFKYILDDFAEYPYVQVWFESKLNEFNLCHKDIHEFWIEKEEEHGNQVDRIK